MLQELYHGRLNLSRLNYGVISLLPKIKDANSILQYRPICVLNVMFKAITKALTLRFTPLARQVISSLQTGFIPGRYILDGCVILHEVLHELKTSHSEGILLQLGRTSKKQPTRFHRTISREGELTPKTRPQFGLQAATRLHEAGIASNRRSAIRR